LSEHDSPSGSWENFAGRARHFRHDVDHHEVNASQWKFFLFDCPKRKLRAMDVIPVEAMPLHLLSPGQIVRPVS